MTDDSKKGFASMDPKLIGEERGRGGSNSEGNFKYDPDRASEAGKIGGRH